MKKLLVLLLVLFLAFSAFAATPTMNSGSQGSSSSNDTSALPSAYVKAAFDMSNQSNTKVVVGFIDSAENKPIDASSTITETQSDVALVADTSTGKATLANDAYLGVFYQIQSATNLTVSLSLSDDLKYDTDDSDNVLGWQVTVKAVAGEGDKTAASAKYTGSGPTTATVYEHNKDTSFASYGCKALEIETSEYSGLAAKEYVGFIVVSVGAK